MEIRGIILAGGNGTRLHPLTSHTSKQLLTVYDKPLIYNALSTLMLVGIRNINLISKSLFLPDFFRLLGDGSKFGLNISYSKQDIPLGIPDAYNVCEEFIGGCPSLMTLGDNIFHGSSFAKRLSESINSSYPTIYAKSVSNPEAFGVVELDHDGKVRSLQEKPIKPLSSLAVLGLYFFDADAPTLAKQLKPSKRGETEILDMVNEYNNTKKLAVEVLSRGDFWTDAGTPDALLDAGNFFQNAKKNSGYLINSPEEIALRKRFISETEFEKLVKSLPACSYRESLEALVTQGIGAK